MILALVTAAVWIPVGLWLVVLGIRNDWDVEIVASDTAHMAVFPGGFLLAGGAAALIVAGTLCRGWRLSSIGIFMVAALGLLAWGLLGEWLRLWQLLIIGGWLVLGIANVLAGRAR